MKQKRFAFMAALLVVISTMAMQAVAQTARRGVRVENPWVRLSRTDSDVASVYMDIFNEAEEGDTLVSVSCPQAEKTTLGKAHWIGTGFKTEPIKRIHVRANGRITLGPGGLEVTVSKLTSELSLGKVLPVTLVFERAGRVEINAVVSNQMLGNRQRK